MICTKKGGARQYSRKKKQRQGIHGVGGVLPETGGKSNRKYIMIRGGEKKKKEKGVSQSNQNNLVTTQTGGEIRSQESGYEPWVFSELSTILVEKVTWVKIRGDVKSVVSVNVGKGVAYP